MNKKVEHWYLVLTDAKADIFSVCESLKAHRLRKVPAKVTDAQEELYLLYKP